MYTMYTTPCHQTCRIASFAEKGCVWWCYNRCAITSSPLQRDIRSSWCHYLITYEMQVRVYARKSKNLRCIWTRLWRNEIAPLVKGKGPPTDFNMSRNIWCLLLQYSKNKSAFHDQEETVLLLLELPAFQRGACSEISSFVLLAICQLGKEITERSGQDKHFTALFTSWLRLLLGCYQ